MKYFFLFSLFTILLSSCSPSEIDHNIIQIRNGVAYLPNETEPFSGKTSSYFESGQQLIEKSYDNGLPHGIEYEWYSNGQKKKEYHHSGDEIGTFKNWHENGSVARDIKTYNNTLIGRNIWQPTGTKTEFLVKDSKINGTYIYETSNFKNERIYENGFPITSTFLYRYTDLEEYTINYKFEYNSDKTKVRTIINYALDSEQIEQKSQWQNYKPLSVSINQSNQNFVITDNINEYSEYNLKTGQLDFQIFVSDDHIILETYNSMGDITGYDKRFIRLDAIWDKTTRCYIDGLPESDKPECRARYGNPDYSFKNNLPSFIKDLIEADSVKAQEREARKAEEERKRKAEEERKRKAEEERKRKAEEERKRKAKEEERKLIENKLKALKQNDIKLFKKLINEGNG